MSISVISTDVFKRGERLLRDTVLVNGISVIRGVPGVGKTTLLQYLVDRYPQIGMGKGNAFYHRIVLTNTASRFLKDITEAISGRKSMIGVHSGSLSFSLRGLLSELKKASIEALVLDEADCIPRDGGVQALVSLRDMALEEGINFSLLMATSGDPKAILDKVPASISRSLKVSTEIKPLTVGEMMGVLVCWSPKQFKELSESLESDKKTQKLVREIHAHTKGNFRRLTFWFKLFEDANAPVTSELLTDICGRMD